MSINTIIKFWQSVQMHLNATIEDLYILCGYIKKSPLASRNALKKVISICQKRVNKKNQHCDGFCDRQYGFQYYVKIIFMEILDFSMI